MSRSRRAARSQTLRGPARVVGVDYGTRRVGVALADPLRHFAQPCGTFSQGEAVKFLVALHGREGLETVVMGWPLLESGQEGAATMRVQQYVNRLKKRLPGTQFVKWDERFTSEEAKDRLARRGAPFARARVDVVAAGIILQEYLDQLPALPGTLHPGIRQ